MVLARSFCGLLLLVSAGCLHAQEEQQEEAAVCEVCKVCEVCDVCVDSSADLARLSDEVARLKVELGSTNQALTSEVDSARSSAVKCAEWKTDLDSSEELRTVAGKQIDMLISAKATAVDTLETSHRLEVATLQRQLEEEQGDFYAKYDGGVFSADFSRLAGAAVSAVGEVQRGLEASLRSFAGVVAEKTGLVVAMAFGKLGEARLKVSESAGTAADAAKPHLEKAKASVEETVTRLSGEFSVLYMSGIEKYCATKEQGCELKFREFEAKAATKAGAAVATVKEKTGLVYGKAAQLATIDGPAAASAGAAAFKTKVATPVSTTLLRKSGEWARASRRDFFEAKSYVAVTMKKKYARSGFPTSFSKSEIEAQLVKSLDSLAQTRPMKKVAELCGCQTLAPSAAVLSGALTALALLGLAALILTLRFALLLLKKTLKILVDRLKRLCFLLARLLKAAFFTLPVFLLKLTPKIIRKTLSVAVSTATFLFLLPFRVLAFPVWTLPRLLLRKKTPPSSDKKQPTILKDVKKNIPTNIKKKNANH